MTAIFALADLGTIVLIVLVWMIWPDICPRCGHRTFIVRDGRADGDGIGPGGFEQFGKCHRGGCRITLRRWRFFKDQEWTGWRTYYQ